MKFTFNWVEEIDDGIICGQLSDNRYFLYCNIDKYYHDVWFFSDNPLDTFFVDDSDSLEDYISDYSIGAIPSEDKDQFYQDMFRFIDRQHESSNYKFVWVEVLDPEYIIFGQLTNDTYFNAGGFRSSDEEPMIAFTDRNPAEYWDSDNSDDMEDWFDVHTYKELQHPENLVFWEDLTNYCEDNGYWA